MIYKINKIGLLREQSWSVARGWRFQKGLVAARTELVDGEGLEIPDKIYRVRLLDKQSYSSFGSERFDRIDIIVVHVDYDFPQ